MEYIFENYPSLVTFSQHLVNVDTIFVEHLKNPEKAKQIYLRLKTKTDNPKLIETLEARIAALEE